VLEENRRHRKRRRLLGVPVYTACFDNSAFLEFTCKSFQQGKETKEINGNLLYSFQRSFFW
jgi:hypothetical protein